MALRASLRTCSSKAGYCLWLIAALAFLCFGKAGFAQNIPRVTLECASDIQQTGSPFELRVIVSWEGDAESHIIVPPEPALPEGLSLQSSSFDATVSDSLYRLTYRFIVAAHTEDRFTVYPVDILYWPRGSSAEMSILTNECSITVENAVRLSQNQILIIAAALLLGVIAAAVFMMIKRCSPRP